MYDPLQRPVSNNPLPEGVSLMRPCEKRHALEVEWSKDATELLKHCSAAIAASDHVGAKVAIPKGTADGAVNRVIKQLEDYGWEVKRDNYSDQRESWGQLVIGDLPEYQRYNPHLDR